jgi:hypothetical protein
MANPTGANSPEPGGRDRRAWVRYPSTPETPLSAIAEEDNILSQKARLRDLSVAGAGLLVESGFAPGTLIDVILINTQDESTWKKLQARVVRNQPQAGGSLLGCTFTQPLTADELKQFI